jgi:hypothetical protein
MTEIQRWLVETRRLATRPSTAPGQIISITFPKSDESRMRRVVKRSGVRPTMKYPSWKVRRTVQTESKHELSVARLLDAAPDVTTFQEQPLEISFVIGKVEHRHYPDFLVHAGHGQELWEVKTAANAADQSIVERTAVLRRELPRHGFTYRVIIADDLYRTPRLENVSKVLDWGRNHLALADREAIDRIISLNGNIALKCNRGQTVGPEFKRHLSRLVLEGQLDFDVERPLTNRTVYTACTPATSRLNLFETHGERIGIPCRCSAKRQA